MSLFCELEVSFSIVWHGHYFFFLLIVENPGSDNLKSSMVIPPPTVIDRVLKELFHEGTVPSCNTCSCS